jgi:hypothetical protein
MTSPEGQGPEATSGAGVTPEGGSGEHAGAAGLSSADGEIRLEPGELVALDAGVAHADVEEGAPARAEAELIEAMSDCVILITMAMQQARSES